MNEEIIVLLFFLWGGYIMIIVELTAFKEYLRAVTFYGGLAIEQGENMPQINAPYNPESHFKTVTWTIFICLIALVYTIIKVQIITAVIIWGVTSYLGYLIGNRKFRKDNPALLDSNGYPIVDLTESNNYKSSYSTQTISKIEKEFISEPVNEEQPKPESKPEDFSLSVSRNKPTNYHDELNPFLRNILLDKECEDFVDFTLPPPNMGTYSRTRYNSEIEVLKSKLPDDVELDLSTEIFDKMKISLRRRGVFELFDDIELNEIIFNFSVSIAMGDFQTSYQLVDQLGDKKGRNILADLALANISFFTEDYSKCLRICKNLIKSYPFFGQPYYLMYLLSALHYRPKIKILFCAKKQSFNYLHSARLLEL